ncbi:MAG TPA: alpha/beta hydrolase [Solirubrobacteraceae bacterium]|nr:alpha/beta hydrolase [Solirubrobacteraceae bacterium]
MSAVRSPHAPRIRQLTVGGVRTPVLEAGPPEAEEAVVFVHGNPGSMEDFRELVLRVAGFARGVSVTMPGFGTAEKPRRSDVSIEGYSRHLGAQLEALGVRRAHLVLHDLGGPWALDWAVRNPDAFRSALLIGTGVLLGYRWHPLARIWQTPVLGEAFMSTASRRAFRALVRRGQERPLPRAFVDRMYDDFDRPTRRTVLRTYRAMRDVASWSEEVTPRLRALDRPALVLWGLHDPYLPVELADRQREAFPRAQTVTLPRSAHWPFADDPDGFTAEVMPWLRDQVTWSG